MEHKRCVVHIARHSAKAMQAFMGRALSIDEDAVIAGAIPADVGKLLEYDPHTKETADHSLPYVIGWMGLCSTPVWQVA